MLYAGLDLSRKRLDFHLLDAEGETVEVGAAPLATPRTAVTPEITKALYLRGFLGWS